MITKEPYREEGNIFTRVFLIHFMKYLNSDFIITKDNKYKLIEENRVFLLNEKFHVLINEKYVRNVIKNKRISNLSKFNNFYYFKVEESEYYDYIGKKFSNDNLLTMNEDDGWNIQGTDAFTIEMIRMYSMYGCQNSYYESIGFFSYNGKFEKKSYGSHFYSIDRSEEFLKEFIKIPQHSTIYTLKI